jgi:GSH-dependent disulfide-bond oxidoreductase
MTDAAAPLRLHYWPTPNGWKVSIALEEMGLAFTLVPVNIGAGDQFKPDFLAISPNNRMPALEDSNGPDGKPIAIFESGAILQYLGRKTGQFYGDDERTRVEVDQWVMWQMGGLGPMSGQANHFRNYAQAMVADEALLEYGKTRYTNEVNRLYGVMERRLADRDYLAGAYSIADMMSWPWIVGHAMFGQDLDQFPNLKRWFERVRERPAVQAGFAAGAELRKAAPPLGSKEAEGARKVLFGQTASNSKEKPD